MTKILPASCVAQVVTVDPIIPLFQPALPTPPILPTAPALLPGAVILSEGVGPSTGLAFMDGDKAWYLPNAAADLKAVLEAVLEVIGEVKTALQTIATGPVTLPGDTAGPTEPALATSLGTRVTALTALEVQLTTLNGVLR